MGGMGKRVGFSRRVGVSNGSRTICWFKFGKNGVDAEGAGIYGSQSRNDFDRDDVEQSRLYLGLGRDGLIPSVFAKVHPTRHTPIHSQIWVGIVACILAGLLNVTVLSHILSVGVGSLAGYSVVAACVQTLRLDDKVDTQISTTSMNYDDLD